MHRGALVAMGYWNDPERTAERFRPAPGRDAAVCTTETAVWSGDDGRRRRGGLPVLRGPSGRDDQDLGLPSQSGRDRGGGLRHRPRGRCRGAGRGGSAPGPARVLAVSLANGNGLDPDSLLTELRREPPLYMVPKHVGRPPASPAPRTASSTATCCARSSRPDGSAGRDRGSRTAWSWAGVARPSGRARGGTPFFAYDRAALTERVAAAAVDPAGGDAGLLRGQGQPHAGRGVAPRGLVDAFDVASAAEMHTALDTGKPAERVSFAGPGKTPDELPGRGGRGDDEMESATEAERVLAIGERLGIRPRVAVRVNRTQVKDRECAPRRRAPAVRRGRGGAVPALPQTLAFGTWTSSASTSSPAPRT